jgi:hypothetical protein
MCVVLFHWDLLRPNDSIYKLRDTTVYCIQHTWQSGVKRKKYKLGFHNRFKQL